MTESEVQRLTRLLHEMQSNIMREFREHRVEVTGIVTAHTADEMQRYSQISDQVHENAQQLLSLQQSISSYVIKNECHESPCEYLSDALLRDENGKIDSHGHRKDHKTRQDEALEMRKLRRHVLFVVVGAAALAISVWTWNMTKRAAIDEVVASMAKDHKSTAGITSR